MEKFKDFIKTITLINESYDVKLFIIYEAIDTNEYCKLIISHGLKVYIIKVDIKEIENKSLIYSIQEYIDIFNICFIKCTICIEVEKFKGECLEFVK